MTQDPDAVLVHRSTRGVTLTGAGRVRMAAFQGATSSASKPSSFSRYAA